MNKKALETLKDNAIYLILLLAFFSLMLIFISNQANGASIWENYYAKEITKVINSAKPGDEIILNVHKATTIAKKNGLKRFSEIFSFDNLKKEVCVKLSIGEESCYSYFNDLDITNPKVNLASGSKGETNTLSFTTIKTKKIENE